MERGVKKETWIAMVLLGAAIIISIAIQSTNPTYFSPRVSFESLQDYFIEAPDLTTDLSDTEIIDLIDDEISNQNNPPIVTDIRNTLSNNQIVNVARGTSYGQSIANTWTNEQIQAVLDFINQLFNDISNDLIFSSTTSGSPRTDYFAARSVTHEPVPFGDTCSDAGEEYPEGHVLCTESPSGDPQTQTCKCSNQTGPRVCNWVLETCEDGEMCVPTDNDDGEEPGCKRLA